MQDKQKSTSLGLDFLNDQQRFRRDGGKVTHNKQHDLNISHDTLTQPTEQTVNMQPEELMRKPGVSARPIAGQPQQRTVSYQQQPQATSMGSQKTVVRSEPSMKHIESTTPLVNGDQLSTQAPKKARFSSFKLRLAIGLASVLVIAGVAGTVLHFTHKTKNSNQTNSNLITNNNLPPISDAPVSIDEIKNYTVNADVPRTLTINKLSLTARVAQVGITYSGAIQTPSNSHDAGWYTSSAKPGAGVMLIVGHVYGNTQPGLFANLDSISVGDIIQVQRGSGQIFNYKVIKKDAVQAEKLTIAQLLAPIVAGKPGLNLMTSTDGQKTAAGNPLDNLVVYTAQQ
jgi:sortase (surface protein transpeptidase)